MRNYYHAQLKQLNDKLVDMASLLEDAIKNSIKSLTNYDNDIKANASEIEKEIDNLEKELESLCFKLILRQQPVAVDLHIISAGLKMITDMERIGDHADDIVELSAHLNESRKLPIINDIIEMGKKSVNMIRTAIEAYIKRDLETALTVCKADDEVDALFTKIKSEIIEIIKHEKPCAEEAPDLLMISKYFERVGDHSVNIAEWIIYAFTGSHKPGGSLSPVSEDVLKDIF